MSKEVDSLLFRPFPVLQMKPSGVDMKVEADEEERLAIAADFGLPKIKSLVANFKLTGRPERIRIVGTVQADIEQICVVSLEPFESIVKEDLDVLFAEPGKLRPRHEEDVAEDLPDPIENGQIDLGAITLEFFALALDPYPRKPGTSFEGVKKALGLSESSGTSLGDMIKKGKSGS
ncbi:DUF177 domain-containing protein [Microvirga sp. W0021]|uniref:DUF177 domain-containing protein n=1 Tax=Hohaiivirga grylli TaxID=3133970 RepID=A0ABV0BK59_9HYPH